MKDEEILQKVLEKFRKDQKQNYEYPEEHRIEQVTIAYILNRIPDKNKEVLKLMDVNYILKLLKRSGSEDVFGEYEEIVECFKDQVTYYQNLGNPHIAEIIRAGEIEDQSRKVELPYLLMEYIEGRSLMCILKERKSPLPFDRILEIAGDIEDALTIIHKMKIIHGDLAPEYVIIKNSGEAVISNVVLTENILTFNTTSRNLISTNSFMKLPKYKAPEQFEDNSGEDIRTDIYAFGAILFEMLTGEPPFQGSVFKIIERHKQEPIPNIRKKNPALPRGIQEVIGTAMAKKVKDRYGSVKEFLTELRSLII
ncbi:MAG: serine/threonine protein kinase [Candidatus Aminicenantes bacterium]|nr:serine/threonine protein kinase [Candidatus Aminicenantes bacterium]